MQHISRGQYKQCSIPTYARHGQEHNGLVQNGYDDTHYTNRLGVHINFWVHYLRAPGNLNCSQVTVNEPSNRNESGHVDCTANLAEQAVSNHLVSTHKATWYSLCARSGILLNDYLIALDNLEKSDSSLSAARPPFAIDYWLFFFATVFIIILLWWTSLMGVSRSVGLPRKKG